MIAVFLGSINVGGNRLAMADLCAAPSVDGFARLVEDHAGRGRERLAIGAGALYIDFIDGVAGSRLTSAFIERRLGCRGTARNLRSLTRIRDRMQAAG